MQNMTELPKFSSLCQNSYKKEFSLRSTSYQLCDFKCESREIKTLKITIFLVIYWSEAQVFGQKYPKRKFYLVIFIQNQSIQ